MQCFRLEMCNFILLLMLAVTNRAASLPHNQSECGSRMDVFMKPEDTQDCGGSHPCHSLSEYTSRSQCYFTSNTTVHFLPGVHLLGENITVRGISNLSLVGSSVDSSQGPSATIQCSRANVGLAFVGCTNLRVRKIAIRYCGRIVPRNYAYDVLVWRIHGGGGQNIYTAVLVADVNTLVIEEARVEASTGYGLLVWNVFGDCVVLNSQFLCNNNFDTSTDCYMQSESPTSEDSERSSPRGNALFLYELDKFGISLQITGSRFSHGANEGNHHFSSDAYRLADDSILQSAGGGLGIRIKVTNPFNQRYITVHLSNCTFDNNVAHFGANTFIFIRSKYIAYPYVFSSKYNFIDYDDRYYVDHIHVIISNCNFHSGQADYSGGGLYFQSDFSQLFMPSDKFPVLCIEILRSTFSDNSGGEGGGMMARMMGSAETIHFRIDACTFQRNKAEIGAGLYMYLPQD